jgi:hypothetical protein
MGRNTAETLRQLDESVTAQLAKPLSATPPGAPGGALDPFVKFALLNTFVLAADRIPTGTAEKIRDYCALYAHRQWKGYDALNYRLMNDGAGLIAAERWPEMVDADGLHGPEIVERTKTRLLQYFDDITRNGSREYGAPIYAAVNLSAVRLLAEFARDETVRRRATLTLDAMLIEIACGWNRGYYVAPASRAKYWISTDTGPDAMESTAASAWIYFGGLRPISIEGSGWNHAFWMATDGGYRPPDAVTRLAQADRHTPFVHRARILSHPSTDIAQTTYHSASYSLASQWDRARSPNDALYKEARRMMLKWVSEKPSSTFAVCMENPSRPYRLQDGVPNALGYGENPFSQYLQDGPTLVGVYEVPTDYPYWRMYVPFPKTGSVVLREERDGWVLAHGGTMMFAFRSASPTAWNLRRPKGKMERDLDKFDLLWSEARSNGWVLETAECRGAYQGTTPHEELRKFGDDLLARTKLEFTPERDGRHAHVSYLALSGRRLELTFLPHGERYTDQAKVDARVIDYGSWDRLSNPWVEQKAGSEILRVKPVGSDKGSASSGVRYDFKRWERTDE